jgi:hypothetical protein
MRVIREQEYTFVTNNRSDRLDLHNSKDRIDGTLPAPDSIFPYFPITRFWANCLENSPRT